MARGRLLNQSYAEDRLIAQLMDEVGGDAVAIYFGLIPFQDREGRVHGDPFVLKGRCWPRSKRVTPEMIESSLRTCDELGLLVWYEVDGERYVCFPNFRKNQPNAQLNREAPSSIPEPPADKIMQWRKPRMETLAAPADDRMQLHATDTQQHAEWKGREVNGREKNVALSCADVLNLGADIHGWKQPRGGPPELELAAVCPMTREEFDKAAAETRLKALKPGFGYFATVVESHRKALARAGPRDPSIGYHPGSTKFGDGDVKL